MPKLKTKNAAAKRFKVTAKGKFKHRQTGLRHILEWRSAKQKRNQTQDVIADDGSLRKIKQMLPYAAKK